MNAQGHSPLYNQNNSMLFYEDRSLLSGLFFEV